MLVDFFNGEDRNDVWVGQLRGRSRLAKETLPQVGLPGHFCWKQLDGHRAVQCDVLSKEHNPHSTPSNFLLKRVTTGDGRLEAQELPGWRLIHDSNDVRG